VGCSVKELRLSGESVDAIFLNMICPLKEKWLCDSSRVLALVIGTAEESYVSGQHQLACTFFRDSRRAAQVAEVGLSDRGFGGDACRRLAAESDNQILLVDGPLDTVVIIVSAAASSLLEWEPLAAAIEKREYKAAVRMRDVS